MSHNDPAFPEQEIIYDSTRGGFVNTVKPGLTKLEWMAGQCVGGSISSGQAVSMAETILHMIQSKSEKTTGVQEPTDQVDGSPQ